MFDILIIASTVAGLALIVVVAAKLDVGSIDAVDHLFAIGSMPARPRGTQEDDLPPLVFRDAPSADALAAPRRVVVDRSGVAKAA